MRTRTRSPRLHAEITGGSDRRFSTRTAAMRSYSRLATISAEMNGQASSEGRTRQVNDGVDIRRLSLQPSSQDHS
jgi:hypothetical protein